ncbi:autotransporter outer membrane beta-barrel domain-containing protein [Leptotrichia alba]|uniref:Autotransporter outer membrane beta-barrel domain-containing protein n=1 Tax=Leptotrichia alba TaxID=3239304 RepID=A0AB39V3D7_9FUSO
MKKMRNIRRLVLLTALCAIISCGGAGGGGETASNNPTPTNPVNPNNPSNPSNPGNLTDPTIRRGDSRYTKTKFEDMTNKDSLSLVNLNFVESENKNEIKDEKYGYKVTVNRDDFFSTVNGGITYTPSPSLSGQKMVIRDRGIGLDVEGDIHFLAYDQDTKNNLTFAINKIITQFARRSPSLREIEVNEGGAFITFDARYTSLNDEQETKNLLLSRDAAGLVEYEFGQYNDSYYGVNLKITGNGDLFEFKNYSLKVDEDINLDDLSNSSTTTKYNKMLQKMINPKVYVNEYTKVTGNKDNQIGIVSIGSEGVAGGNSGTIELNGNNTIAAYVNNSSFFNSGTITVKKNSTGIYAISDEVSDNLKNIWVLGGNINIGENSTGIHIYSKYYNNSHLGDSNRFFNNGLTETLNTIKGDENAHNAVGIVFNVGEESLSEFPDKLAEGFSGGIIELRGNRPTGIYLTGKGKSRVTNFGGKIIIGDSKNIDNPGIGMYSDNPNGEMYNSSPVSIIEIGKNSIGMAGVNGTTIRNESGTITIKGDNSIGMYLSGGAKGFNTGTIKTEGSPKNAVGVFVGQGAEFTNEYPGKIIIDSAGGAGIVVAGGTIKNYGDIQVSGGAIRERIEKPLLAVSLSERKMPVKKDMRVYVDSLGKTNPIKGLANLGLKGAELLIGAEATEKTNATEVTVGKDVLDPFNKSIKESNIPYWTVGSGSLIWEANPEIKDNRIEKVTLRKQSYTKFADEKTKDVAEGLDEKYVVASEKDKQVFNYMNTLRDAESLGKAYKEIDGSQYINVQQRINQTDNLLDNQISSLQKDNVDKAGHHVETFFNKDKHDFKTDEVPDTTNTAFGASYLFNNTDSNWGAYGGVAINNYKFKDTGHSKESVSMLKAGGYKKFDLSIGDLDWTLGGDVFVSQNSMKRRIMTDKVYENKADYNAYGFSVKNEISKTYELGENSAIKPYGALKLGYGRFNRIKEKDSTLGMDVKGNSYYSFKPSAGVELAYTKGITGNTRFKAALDLAYEHELGNAGRKENQMKYINTNKTYRLKGEKAESRGNVRSGVKVGLETGNFNFSVNGGYDTKDKNAHVGVGIGASF